MRAGCVLLALVAARAGAAELTKPPRLLQPVEARYPAEELASGRAATVTLALDVTADGAVAAISVVESAGEHFDAAAIEAAQQLQFEPAEVDGVPAPVRITYRVAFVLKPPPAPPPPAPPPPAPPLPAATPASRPSYESLVQGERHAAGPVETRVAAAEARRVPGTEGDVLKVVENLPGVARPSFGSQQLVVWGAATADTRVLVDGVEIPALHHAGGLRSTVNGELVRSVELVPGAYDAAYGRGLGGLVRVETRPLPAEGVHGSVAADVLDASALLTAAIGKRFTIAVAGRYSWLDLLLSKIVSPSVQSYFPIPRWDDYQLHATVRLGEGEQLSLLFLAADDHLTRALPAADPAEARRDATDASTYRAILRYSRRDGESLGEVTPYFGWDDARQTTDFGGRPTRLEVQRWRFGLRASWQKPLARRFTLTVGIDLDGTRSQVDRAGSLTLPPREGDLYVFGQPPGDDVHADRFSALQVDLAPFVRGELKLGPVTIVPGLRLAADLTDGDHAIPAYGATPALGFRRVEWMADPRLAVRVRAGSRVSLTAAGGLYHQMPAPEDLSPAFGNPKLGLASAWHLTAGLEVRITDAIHAEAVGYYKWLSGLASRNPSPTPPVGQALVQEGSGRAYGAQFFLRVQPWRGLFGWIGYTVGRSERTDHPNGPTRLFDFDQTHVLTVVASYQYRRWSFGARLRYATGFPRTPVVGAYFDPRDDRFEPLFGAHNSIRLDDFFQLDLRVDRTFVWQRAALDLYLEVQNVTYRQNAEELAYSEDWTRRGAIRGLPTLAVLGAKVSF